MTIIIRDTGQQEEGTTRRYIKPLAVRGRKRLIGELRTNSKGSHFAVSRIGNSIGGEGDVYVCVCVLVGEHFKYPRSVWSI